MGDSQSTPIIQRTLPSKSLQTQSNYSPRTLENTRNRFAGLFTAFGAASDVTASPKLKSSSLVPRLSRPDLSAGVNDEASSQLPARTPIPVFQLNRDERGPASAGPSKNWVHSQTMSVKPKDLNNVPETCSPSSGAKFWSFLSPSPVANGHKLSPASSIRRRMREKSASNKTVRTVDDDDEEWDEACFVDLKDELDKLKVATELPANTQLPLPDEIMMQIIRTLPPSLALMQTLSITCKSLASLAASQYLWKRLYLSHPGWQLPQDLHTGSIDHKQLYKSRLALTRQWLDHVDGQSDHDMPTFQRMQLISHTDSVYAVQFSGQWLISGSRDCSVKLWKLPPLGSRWSDSDDMMQPLVTVAAAHDSSVLCLQFEEHRRNMAGVDRVSEDDSSNFGFLVTGSSDTTINLWRIDWADQKDVRILKETSLRGHTAGVLDLALTKDYIISASKDTTVKIWSRASRDCLMTLSEHVGPVNDVAVNQSETQLASVSGDGRLIIWNLVSGEVVKIIAGGERGVACVCWNGNYLLVGSNDRSMKLYYAGSGDLVRTFEGHEDLVRTVAFDANVGVAVSGSYDKTIRVWNLRTGALLRVIPAHESLVFGVRIDTSRIVSISHDRTIIVQQLGVGLPYLELCV